MRHTTQHIETLEEMLKLRTRRRKASDRPTFEATVGALVCDVIHRHLTAPGKWIAVPLSNRVLGNGGRYRTRVLGQTLPAIVDRLSRPELGCIDVRKGERRFFGPGRATTIRLGQTLMRRVDEEGFELSDFGRGGTEELIILKRPKEDRWDVGEWIEYEDTSTTLRYRDQLRRINEGLAQADLAFDDGEEPLVDVADRTLRRYFTGAFDRNGRLFGGFWQPLKKERRFDGLSISGEPVAELDFGQIGPRLAYARAGAALPQGDLYGVLGFDLQREGVREGIKAVLNAMLASSARPTRFWPDTRKGLRGSFETVERCVRQHHAPIAHLFYSGVGLELMFRESEILVDVLLRCQEAGIVALPIHDAILVPRSGIERAKAIMLEVFATQTGVDGHVDLVLPRSTNGSP